MVKPGIPPYIKKELRDIDPRYFFEWDDDSSGFLVRRRFQFDRNKLFIRNPAVGYYQLVDSVESTLREAIRDLRYRKHLGRQREDPMKDLENIKRRNKEAKQKRIRAAREMQADGLMFGHRMSTRKSYDMGGHRDSGRNKNSGT